jgi:hypothetical protein
MSQYDDLAGTNGQSILRQLYPYPTLADCPLTADAVDDYLRTGQIIPVPPSLYDRFTVTANWRSISRQALVRHIQSLGSNHHVVVRGTRPRRFQRQHQITSTHFFVLANIGNRVYVIDAMGQQITIDVSAYIENQGFNRLAYTEEYEAEEPSLL